MYRSLRKIGSVVDKGEKQPLTNCIPQFIITSFLRGTKFSRCNLIPFPLYKEKLVVCPFIKGSKAILRLYLQDFYFPRELFSTNLIEKLSLLSRIHVVVVVNYNHSKLELQTFSEVSEIPHRFLMF